jgi:hypothetical protein
MALGVSGRAEEHRVPSSEKMPAFVEEVEQIIDRYPNRRKLILMVADSTQTWSFTDKRYKGFIVAEAAQPEPAKLPLDENRTIPPDLNWRGQLSRDAVNVFARNLASAFTDGYLPTETRKLRAYVLANINISSKEYTASDNIKFKFNDDNQREPTGATPPGNFHVLLCLANPGSANPWKNIDDPDAPCQVE